MLLKLRSDLLNIIDKAYGRMPDQQRENLKRFYLRFPMRHTKSFGGACNPRTGEIRIMWVKNKQPWEIIMIAIHEVSHYIDFKFRGTTDHSKEFYLVYQKLLFAALDLGVLTKEDIGKYREETYYSDRNKVFRMARSYSPSAAIYMEELEKSGLSG